MVKIVFKRNGNHFIGVEDNNKTITKYLVLQNVRYFVLGETCWIKYDIMVSKLTANHYLKK